MPDGSVVEVPEGAPGYIDGELEDCLLISVPLSTTVRAAQQLREQVEAATKRTVLIYTHNVEFLKVTKLSPREGAALLKQVEQSNDDANSEPPQGGDGAGD